MIAEWYIIENMKILFAFYDHPELSVIQRSLLKAFQENGHTVTTCGFSDNIHTELDFSYPTPISLLQVLKDIRKKPDILFLCWPTIRFFLTDIEKSPIPTAVYVFDTQLPRMHACIKGYSLLFDYVFCVQKDFYEELKKIKTNAFWCPVAADPTIHKSYKTIPQQDVVFAGITNPFHNPRRSLYLSLIKRFFTVKTGRVYDKELARFLSQGTILFNIPVTDDLNTRVFEAMACKRLLITPTYQHGLTDLFVDRKHFVGYKNIVDLFRQLTYYKRHKIEREKIAKRGQQEIRKFHLYKNRAEYIYTVITNSQRKKRNKQIASNQLIMVAISYYLLGSMEETKRWLVKFLNQKNVSFKRIPIILCLMVINRGGQKLQRRIARFFSHNSGLRVILWQMTHL